MDEHERVCAVFMRPIKHTDKILYARFIPIFMSPSEHLFPTNRFTFVRLTSFYVLLRILYDFIIGDTDEEEINVCN